MMNIDETDLKLLFLTTGIGICVIGIGALAAWLLYIWRTKNKFNN